MIKFYIANYINKLKVHDVAFLPSPKTYIKFLSKNINDRQTDKRESVVDGDDYGKSS